MPSDTDWARLKDDEGKLNDALLEPRKSLGIFAVENHVELAGRAPQLSVGL